MFKTLVKLAVVVLIANAAYRVGLEYLNHIKFRDAIREAAMFKARNDAELTQRVMNLAIDYDIPLTEHDFEILRAARHVEMSGHYDKLVEIVPTFTYPWSFSWDIDVYTSPEMPPLPRQR